MAETLAMKDKRDAKRERDNYAVKLRKEKRYVLFFSSLIMIQGGIAKKKKKFAIKSNFWPRIQSGSTNDRWRQSSAQ